MKTIKIFAACSFLLIALAGCDLTALNVNPNEPDDSVNYNMNYPRLASTLRNGIPMEGDDEQRVKALMIDFYAQIADGGNFTTKYYQMNEDWNRRMYRRVQSNVSSLNIVIRNLMEFGDEYRHTIAVAKIWRVFTQAYGVDFFGPIPFAKYSVVEENPPYMSVEDTYNEFFKELDEAANMLSETSVMPIFIDSNSDILYRNNPAKWRLFANSLRLRYALRLSEVAPELCREQAAKALEAGVFSSSLDNAYLPPKADGSWGQDYNYTMFQITWGGALNMTKTFEKLVTGIGGVDFPLGISNQRSGKALSNVHPDKVDPRAPVMFDPAYETGDWKGIVYGLPEGVYNVGANRTVNFSEFGFLYSNGYPYTTRPYDVMLYEEVCFLKAEAALMGVGGLDAKTEYEKGVRASFATWGITSSVADSYLASTDKNLAGTSANFDDISDTGNTKLEKIITQKYIAAFPDVAMESWNDKRRLNLPRFDVSETRYEVFYDPTDKNIKNPKNFIRRVQYPVQESQINQVEYQKGVELLGGDDNVTTPLWWDKLSNYCTSLE